MTTSATTNGLATRLAALEARAGGRIDPRTGCAPTPQERADAQFELWALQSEASAPAADDEPLGIDPDEDASPRLTLAEWLDEQAERFRDLGTGAGELAAQALRELASEARILRATTADDLLARRAVMLGGPEADSAATDAAPCVRGSSADPTRPFPLMRAS